LLRRVDRLDKRAQRRILERAATVALAAPPPMIRMSLSSEGEET
jgi:hypothetical protein